jgi:tetratricopeptide (TPR) repeat protein
MLVVQMGEEELKFRLGEKHASEALYASTRTSLLVTRGPSRGLPPRTYVPILVVAMLAFGGVLAYFLRIGLSTTGSALGPGVVAQQGDSNIQATPVPGEVVIPQSGGAPGNSVGGGSPPQAAAGAPPAPIQRLLTELKGRVARNPHDLSALVGLASLYADAAKFPQALPYYKRALALDPGNPDLRTDYATALHGSNEDLESLAQLQVVLAAKPDFPPALFNEGIVASSIGRRTQAVAAFQKFLKVAPNDSHAEDARTALKNIGA